MIELCKDLRHGSLSLRQRAAHGFTLVEIMIVVAILGLLAVIAIPNFIKSRNATRVKSCMKNLRVLDTAKAQWALDNRRPTSSTPSTAEIIPYLRDGALPACPSDGTYRIRSLRRIPLCSLWADGHTLKNLNGDDDPALD